jgi:hypothetical protein
VLRLPDAPGTPAVAEAGSTSMPVKPDAQDCSGEVELDADEPIVHRLRDREYDRESSSITPIVRAVEGERWGVVRRRE